MGYCSYLPHAVGRPGSKDRPLTCIQVASHVIECALVHAASEETILSYITILYHFVWYYLTLDYNTNYIVSCSIILNYILLYFTILYYIV